MRDHTYKYFAILSAFLSTNTDKANAQRHEWLADDLKSAGMTFERVRGCYKGVEECSFIIFDPDEASIKTLARKFSQESFLIRTNRNDCFLHFVESGNVQFIGEFKYVPEEVATDTKRHDGYTILHDKGVDLYYVSVLKHVVLK